MKRKTVVASAQLGGLMITSAGLGLVRIWAGLVAFGLGLVLFGVGLERAES